MKDYIIDRVQQMANHAVQTGCTLRELARIFGVGKSTAHKDMSERLRFVDYKLYLRVSDVLRTNLTERHIRGGQATKRKFGK